MNQAAEAEFTGVPGKESRVRQTHPEGPAMLLRLDGDSDLRQQEAARLLTKSHVRGSPGATARRRGGQ
jgi:hypothetical protein